MTHQPGETITIASYNDIIAQVNTIFGTGIGSSGYGGDSTNVPVITDLPVKVSGDTIDNQEWLDLRNAQDDVAAHQGTVLPADLPFVIDLETADSIQAFEDQTPDNFAGEIDSAANLAIIITNKDNVASVAATSTAITHNRTTPWSSFIEHQFIIAFVNSDAARHYFNTGGQISVGASRELGAGSPQNIAWTALLNANSPYSFTQTDYFALTSNFVVKQSVSSTGSYSTNTWTISVKRDDAAGPNEGAGSILRFKSSFLDGHTNVFDDIVDGTFSSNIGEIKAVGTFVKTSPIFTTITSLTSGS